MSRINEKRLHFQLLIMKLLIQNMVSLRSKLLVKAELDKKQIPYHSIELGEVILQRNILPQERDDLNNALMPSGLEIMDDKNTMIIEKIKNIVVEMIHYTDELPRENFSAYLSSKMNMNYQKLSDLFSKTKGITIEHFIILHKIEKIKELIIYDKLSMNEISFKMHYSSTSHLSNQFKKVTGLTPTFFKNLQKRNRKNLEDL